LAVEDDGGLFFVFLFVERSEAQKYKYRNREPETVGENDKSLITTGLRSRLQLRRMSSQGVTMCGWLSGERMASQPVPMAGICQAEAGGMEWPPPCGTGWH